MSDINFKTEMEFIYGESRILAAGVQRIVAENPSVFTYKGTNTYIIGQGDDLAVIDPGPEDESHFTAIMKAVGTKRVTHIFITHSHGDHIDGLPRLATATGAKVYGYGRQTYERDKEYVSPFGKKPPDLTFIPDVKLADGEKVTGSDWALTAVFTPGHTPDHMCFQLDGTGILFSGDHVMAWNTSVIAPPDGHMGDYFTSLEKLLERTDSVFYPGHGGQITDPKRFTKAYLLHRKVRERAILSSISKGCHTIPDIVSQVYKGLDKRLITAASLSVLAHIEHMVQKGLIDVEQPITSSSILAPAADQNK